MLTLELF